jgi:hypothetical protein
LYFLTFTINVSVKLVISCGWGVIRFRSNIFGETARMWGELKEICEDVTLNNKQDKCVGMLEKNDIFSVKSIVTSQNVRQFRGRLEGLLCIASEITGFFRAFVSKT